MRGRRKKIGETMGKPRVSPAKVLIEEKNDRVRKETPHAVAEWTRYRNCPG